MLEKIGEKLLKFTDEEKNFLRNSVDYFGLNHYTTRLILYAKYSSAESDYYRAQETKRIGIIFYHLFVSIFFPNSFQWIYTVDFF